MRRLFALAVLSLLGCGSGSNLPVQEPGEVAALFVSTVRACTAGLTPEGGIDQAAMARSGWHVVRRRLMIEGGTERELALNALGTLRRTEYEATEWARDGVANRIDLGRWPVEPHRMHDQCDVRAQTENRAAAESVVAAMRTHFGRPSDRRGGRPNGGDALTPGFGDIDSTIHYWALPRNDAYVAYTEDGFVRLEIVAMPDRAALDQYHPDRPEMRIPIVEGG